MNRVRRVLPRSTRFARGSRHPRAPRTPRHPAPLGRPVGDRLREPAGALSRLPLIVVLYGTHLIHRHAVGRQLQRAINAALPIVVRLSEHAGDEIDVDLRKVQRAREFIGAADLG